MKNNVNLYIVFGTIPSLYAQINTFLDKTTSYVWLRQAGFFQPEANGENVVHYQKLHDYDMNFIRDDYYDIVKKIKEILRDNKNTKFTVYTDDVRVQFILKPLIEAGIYHKIDKYILLSEGSLTMTYLTSINASYENKMKAKWKYLVESIEQGINIDTELSKIDKYAPWFASLHNVVYFLPCKELIENIIKKSEHSFLKEIILKEYDVGKSYLKLNKENQQKFIPSNFNFEFKKNKKYLIINGTYDFGSSEITVSVYTGLINQLLIDINEEYILFFKPHPLFPIIKGSDLEKYLLDNNIEILPAKMPLEVILWLNQNIYITGFCSSINSLVDSDKTISFFGDQIGFSKLLDNAGKFKAKKYQLEISQDIAAGLLKDYGNNKNAIENLNRKNEELLVNISEMNKQIAYLNNEILKTNNL